MLGLTLAGRYTLLSALGQGGMGIVYEANDSESGDRVAVKVLHEQHGPDKHNIVKRFEREALVLRSVDNEHIVRVLGSGHDSGTGRAFIVTELLAGETLQGLIDRAGRLPIGAAAQIAAQTLRGLIAAHAMGVVHRDIKPANVFLAKTGDTVTAKILDFGIAKMLGGLRSAEGESGSNHLTTTNTILGSPLYMSPEQIQSSRDVDHRTDIWAVGCMLYAMLAGRAPHEHISAMGQLMVTICVSPSPPLLEVAPWVPKPIADVVHKALSIQVNQRHSSAPAMLSALLRAAAGELGKSLSASELSDEHERVVVAAPPDSEGQPRDATMLADTIPAAKAMGSLSPAFVLGTKANVVTVDPRPLLGPANELWTFSLQVHSYASSLIARIWKALLRAGAKLPANAYGTEWVLVDARSGATVQDRVTPEGERLTLDEAGIRPRMVLLVKRPDANG